MIPLKCTIFVGIFEAFCHDFVPHSSSLVERFPLFISWFISENAEGRLRNVHFIIILPRYREHKSSNSYFGNNNVKVKADSTQRHNILGWLELACMYQMCAINNTEMDPRISDNI